MAGCDKADRNRKSAYNVAYKAGNRQEVNKVRKMRKAGQDPSKRPVPNYKSKKEVPDVPKSADVMVNHQRYGHIRPLYWVQHNGVTLDVTPHYGEAVHHARNRGGKVVVYGRLS